MAPRRSKPSAAARPAPGASRPVLCWNGGHAASGFILGFLILLALTGLTGNVMLLPWWDVAPLLAGMAAALLALTAARPLLWVAGGLTAALWCLVAYTPVSVPAVRSVVRRDPLRRVEVAVVLSANVQNDGDPSEVSQLRLQRGYELLAQGYARRLLLTRVTGRPSYLPAVRRQLAALGIRAPVEETDPVRNTRDEAAAVAEMARERGWGTLLLVSDATHMRRAAAVFEKAGARVLCSPGPMHRYDLEELREPGDRLRGFRDWLHEAIGYEVYRLRGWI